MPDGNGLGSWLSNRCMICRVCDFFVLCSDVEKVEEIHASCTKIFEVFEAHLAAVPANRYQSLSAMQM